MKPRLNSKEGQALIRELVLKEVPDLANDPDELNSAVEFVTSITKWGFDMERRGIIKGGVAGIIGCAFGFYGAYAWKTCLKPKIKLYRLKKEQSKGEES